MTYDGNFSIKNNAKVKIPNVMSLDVAPKVFNSTSSGYPNFVYTTSNSIYISGSDDNQIYFADKSDPSELYKKISTLSPAGTSFLCNITPTLIGDYFWAFGTSTTTTIYKAHKDNPHCWAKTSFNIQNVAAGAGFYNNGTTLYLIGGETAFGSPVNSIQTASVSDPTTWTTSTNVFPTTFSWGTLVNTGSALYIYGGGPGAPSNKIYTASLSDPTIWTDTGSTLPISVYRMTSYCDGSFIYLYGGITNALSPNTHVYKASVSVPTSFSNVGSGTSSLYGIYVNNNYVYLYGSSQTLIASTSSPQTVINLTGNLNHTTYNSSAIKLDKKIWMFGGVGTETAIKYTNDNATNYWTTSASVLPGQVTSATLIKTSTNLYLIGTDASSYSGSWYTATISDPETWTLVDTSGPLGYGGNACIIDDYVYYFGGSALHSVDKIYRASIYNGKINSDWTADLIGILPVKLLNFSLILAGNYLYLVGGRQTGPVTNVCSSVVYRIDKDNIASSNWVNAGSISVALDQMSIFVINGHVYLVGGSTSGSADATHIYKASLASLANGIVSFSNDAVGLTNGLYASSSLCINDRLVLLGGRNASNTALSSVYKSTTFSEHKPILPNNIGSQDSVPVIDVNAGTVGSYSKYQRLGILPWLATNR